MEPDENSLEELSDKRITITMSKQLKEDISILQETKVKKRMKCICQAKHKTELSKENWWRTQTKRVFEMECSIAKQESKGSLTSKMEPIESWKAVGTEGRRIGALNTCNLPHTWTHGQTSHDHVNGCWKGSLTKYSIPSWYPEKKGDGENIIPT